LLLGAATAEAQQDAGHKILGTLGLRAGSQPGTGLYLSDRFVGYFSSRLRDRAGAPIRIPVEIDAQANAIGIQLTYEIRALRTFVNTTVGIPIARVSLRSDRAEASLDRFGFADVFIQPLKLGWSLPRVDLTAGYALYIPTGQATEGVSRGFYTEELSVGSTIYLEPERTLLLSVVASYELNHPKLGPLDLVRGDSFQVQGGLGTRLLDWLDLGLVGYALWQVRDTRGADVPAPLRGARDEVYGIGVELGANIVALRTQLTLRYAGDVWAAARPQGHVLFFGLNVIAWSPRHRDATAKKARPRREDGIAPWLSRSGR